jgi:hypothetical protein
MMWKRRSNVIHSPLPPSAALAALRTETSADGVAAELFPTTHPVYSRFRGHSVVLREQFTGEIDHPYPDWSISFVPHSANESY